MPAPALWAALATARDGESAMQKEACQDRNRFAGDRILHVSGTQRVHGHEDIGAREIPLLQPAKSAAHDREIYSIGGSIMSSVVIAIAAFKLR
jgi:hypothetical protein